jgi:hypothetical protein
LLYLNAFLLGNLRVLGCDVVVDLSLVQVIELRVFVYHIFDEIKEVVVVGERSFHLHVGSVFHEVFAQFLAIAFEFEHVVAHNVDHLGFLL